MAKKRKLRLAVLISGTGRTLKNLLARIAKETLSAEIALVISNNPVAPGLQYAEESYIPIEIIERHKFDTKGEFSAPIFDACRKQFVDYVVLAGYLRLLEIPPDFTNRVLNIHPSLIPTYCGEGIYGDIVHAKVLQRGLKISGCTVHFVNQKYDDGPIILQKAVEVFDTDTLKTLNDRVFEAECEAYPEAIELLFEGRIEVNGQLVKIAPRQTEDDF
ncbi:MAG: phosphoribosylglycinamide formyltransferase [Planctomycetaceae bacterium]|nr:phosphoribosylglycinamide formyltransferase [Planctomycetaceae bacterium]